VDHFAASLDEFHEREVSRRDVFRALHRVMDLVGHVSFQLTGRGDDDPYLAGLVADVRREFSDEVPMLVGRLNALGRARTWLDRTAGRPAPDAMPAPSPCDLAAWPLVTYDGTVFACCNQDLLEASRPPHLIIGHAAQDGWPVLRERFTGRQLLRAIRVFGPQHTQARFGAGCADASYCGSCVGLHRETDMADGLADYFESPGGRRLEAALREVIEHPRPQDFIRRVGSPRYSDLVTLGWNGAGPGAELQTTAGPGASARAGAEAGSSCAG